MIDTKLLRQKILDLAIRGKLVPQDPKDEPASELLKKIKAEKEALIKAGKLKRDKHESFIFQGDDKRYYEQIDGKTTDVSGEIPFAIPESWCWSRLGNICDYGSCQSVEPSEIKSSDWVLDLEDIEKDSGRLLCRIEKKDRPPTSSKHIFKRGNVLYSKLRTYLNKVLIADQDGYCTSEILPLDFGKYIIPEFARYVLMSKMFLDYTAQCGYGVKMPRLGTDDGRKALFPLPPFAEQKRIVMQIESLLKCVDEIDRESESLEKSITLAKQKILDLAIRGKLVPQDPADEPASELLKKIKTEKEALIKAGKLKRDKHESFIFRGDDNCYYWHIDGKTACNPIPLPFHLPKNWLWVNLGDIMDIARGGSPRPIDYYLTDEPNGYNWIKIGDVSHGSKYITSTKEKIRAEGLSKTRYVESGDFLLSNSMSFGRPYILKINGCIHDGWLVLHPLQQTVDADFLFFALSSTTIYELLRQAASGSTVKNLNSDTVKQLLFPLPPYCEQKRIARRLQKVLDYLFL